MTQSNAKQYKAGRHSTQPIYRTVIGAYGSNPIVRLTFADGTTLDYTRRTSGYSYQRKLAMKGT